MVKNLIWLPFSTNGQYSKTKIIVDSLHACQEKLHVNCLLHLVRSGIFGMNLNFILV